MTKGNDKIFISYRRSVSQHFARAVYQHLHFKGHDVFFDVESVGPGIFERIILNQIKARAHFLVVLAPGSMERLKNRKDWLRKEILCALEYDRNIIPITHGDFDFAIHGKGFPPALAKLKDFQALRIHDDYFEEGMDRLVKRYLTLPFYGKIIETPAEDQVEVARKQAEAREEKKQTEAELTAEEYFNKGLEASDPKDRIKYYSLAIEKNPKYAAAYNNRGGSYYDLKQYKRAIEDYAKAIEIDPGYTKAYNNRSVSLSALGKYKEAFASIETALALEPNYAYGYSTKAEIYHDMGNFEEAVNWYDKTLALDPEAEFAPVKQWREQALAKQVRDPKE